MSLFLHISSAGVSEFPHLGTSREVSNLVVVDVQYGSTGILQLCDTQVLLPMLCSVSCTWLIKTHSSPLPPI